jgi:SAM-dependent methyltransferase
VKLSETFNLVPELYDRARPRYPAELYDHLAENAGLRRGARVLEIAPATGIVTVELAERGCEVTAVEMGEGLAEVARRNVASFPNARIDVARFEDWAPPSEPFDLVCCATAFSWLERDVRLAKCAALLRPGGMLAVWDALHVAGGTAQFFIDVQDCYERWDPETPPGLRLQETADIPVNDYGLAASGEFELLAVRDFPLEIPYSRAEYLDVLHTYSGHIALRADLADGLYGCIGNLIDEKYGSRIAKAYAFRLLLARRR